MLLGGENEIIEIDETKLGKKSSKGDIKWRECKCFDIREKKREKYRCLQLKKETKNSARNAKKHVTAHSIIYSDMWRGYESVIILRNTKWIIIPLNLFQPRMVLTPTQLKDSALRSKV